MRIEGSNRRLPLHWTSLAEGNANANNGIEVPRQDDKRCPACKIGRLVLIGIISAYCPPVRLPRHDSS
jgi:hypothetical protein